MSNLVNKIKNILRNNEIKAFIIYESFIIILTAVISIIQYSFKAHDLQISGVLSVTYHFYQYIFMINIISIYLIFSLLSINKIFLRFITAFMIITTAMYMFYNLYYNIHLSGDIIYVAIKRHELAGNFITNLMIKYVLFYGLFPAVLVDFFILRKIKYKYYYFNKAKLIILVIIGIVLLAEVNIFNKIDRKWYFSSKPYLENIVYPESLINGVYEVFIEPVIEPIIGLTMPIKVSKELEKAEKISNYKNYNYKDSVSANTPKTIVFVFGESFTSKHLKSSGYYRSTTSNLDKQKNLIFLPKTETCATTTMKAQPCISKPITSEEVYSNYSFYFYNNRSISSFVKILKSNGYKTYYIHEENKENSIRKIVNEADKDYILDKNLGNIPVNIKSQFEKDQFTRSQITNKYKSLLLDVMKEKGEKKLIMVWLRGSHISYDSMYTKEFMKFTPTLGNVNNSRFAVISPDIKTKEDFEALNNSYDNTIVYTDSIMSWSINKLNKSKQNTMMFFVGDHGDNLTDNKLSMHGMPISMAPKEVMNPAMFVWFSDNWLKNVSNKDIVKTKVTSKKLYNYENVFYDVVNCAGLTSKYQPKNSNICNR